MSQTESERTVTSDLADGFWLGEWEIRPAEGSLSRLGVTHRVEPLTTVADSGSLKKHDLTTEVEP